MENVIRLKKGIYNESKLVDKVCTEAQKISYHKKERFSGGSAQKSFLDKLSMYCDYEYDAKNRRYRITSIHEVPTSPCIRKMHKGIYQHLTPLVLSKLVYESESEDHVFVGTAMDLAKSIKCVNKNYNVIKYNPDDVYEKLNFDSNILSEYFNKVENRINEYIHRCLKYLKDAECVTYENIRIIGLMPRNAFIENWRILVEPAQIRKATEQEYKDYFEMIGKACDSAHILSDNEKWYGKKAIRYKTELTRLLRKSGILFLCKGLEITVRDEARCKSILQGFNEKTITQRRQEIGTVLKAVMDTNAEKRFDKNPALGGDYIEQFKRLSEITLLYDADDVLKLLPSVKGRDYQEVLREKYGFEVEYGLGIKK